MSITALLLLLLYSGCSDQNKSPLGTDSAPATMLTPNHSQYIANSSANIIEVTAYHNEETEEHLFQASKNTIPEGWNTFRLINPTHSAHFYLLWKVPQSGIAAANDAGQSVLQHWYETVTVPFQEEFNPYIAGDYNNINGDPFWDIFVPNLFGAVLSSAPWFADAVPMGGPGITSGGITSQTTVNLSSGVYIVECYVKDENQEFHSYNGMLDMITVTEESLRYPGNSLKPTAEVSISSDYGITYPKNIRPGIHRIEISFEDQAVYSHLLGHNVQLVRLPDDYDSGLLSRLEEWMDWTKENGLIHDAPEGVKFLGGSMEMQGDNKAYFTINLKPGHYAWIAEVPDASDKGMLKTFSVPGDLSHAFN